MPLQNRVTPEGQIVAQPWRGTLMGNRGILHDEAQTLRTRRWQHPHWVICVLRYKDWHRKVMRPNNYTELFFLDECTALAAGHRPCGLCRHADYTEFKRRFAAANAVETLTQMDRLMQRDRVTRSRDQVRYSAAMADLPDGAFILYDGAAHLVWDAHLLRCDGGTYSARLPRPPRVTVTVLTPRATVATLVQGYRPRMHAAAHALI